MKQAEIQIGGIYVAKGKGLKAGEKVKVVGVVPPSDDHPARIKIINLGTGKNTKPLVKSFQASYAVEQLPQPVTDFSKAHAAAGNGGAHGEQQGSPQGSSHAQGPKLAWSGQFDVTNELDALYGALSAALDAVAAIRRKMS